MDETAISVLGPLRVTVAGVPVALPAKQRILLAILAFQANRVVPQHRLIEAAWGEDASPGLTRTLHSHVFQVRRALAAPRHAAHGGPRIVTEDGGYRLQADPATIDAKAFPRMLEAARGTGADARAAVALLTRAVALWRGPGTADVGDEPASLAEIQQLEWLRLSAIEDLVRLRLGLGEHEQVVPVLRAEIAEAPYNEQLWASLMIALARCGKRAEALIAYRQATEALRAELDIEPGRELRDLALRLRDGIIPDGTVVLATHDDPPIGAVALVREPTILAC